MQKIIIKEKKLALLQNSHLEGDFNNILINKLNRTGVIEIEFNTNSIEFIHNNTDNIRNLKIQLEQIVRELFNIKNLNYIKKSIELKLNDKNIYKEYKKLLEIYYLKISEIIKMVVI